MSDQNTQEPTMEEILASIRRIISEDEPAPAPATAEEAGTNPHGDIHEDVLELTERVEEDDEAASESMFEPEDEEEDAAVETSGDLDIYSRQPQAAAAEDFSSDYDDEPEEQAIVSPPTAATASSSFVQLARTVAMPAEGRVLEDVVRELLRPMLKEWLDANLQDVVENAVQAEVERISRRRFS